MQPSNKFFFTYYEIMVTVLWKKRRKKPNTRTQ